MNGVVATYTIIHVAPAEFAPAPYGVVIVDGDGRRVAARADGDLAWLRIGAPVAVEDDERFGFRCIAHGRIPAGTSA